MCVVASAHADTIERYMNIANNIPKMEMKADSDSQIWVRSARNILNLTCESIAETLTTANKAATERGKPLFCFKGDTQGLEASSLNILIQKTYREMAAPQEMKDSMTVSEIALMGLMQTFPCAAGSAPVNSQRPSNGLPSFGEMIHVSTEDGAH